MLETGNIFIDTSIFYKINFEFEGTSLKKLIEFYKEKNLTIYISDIVIEEVKANISESIDEAINAFKRFNKTYYILKNIDAYKKIFQYDLCKESKEDLILKARDELNLKFENFLKECKVKKISLSHASVGDVFDLYFSNSFPFDVAKKKEEFPDAFILDVIDKFCSKKNDKMYLITNDKGMLNYTEKNEHIIGLPKIEALFDLINQEDDRYEEIMSLCCDSLDKLKDKIGKEFMNMGFICDGCWEGDAEVVAIDLKEVQFNREDIDLLDINDKFATLNITTVIKFDVQVETTLYNNFNLDLSNQNRNVPICAK